jgi:hypothetical protein
MRASPAGTPRSPLLHCALLFVLACGHGPSPVRRHEPPPVSPPAQVARPAPHIMVFAGPLPGVTVTQAPPEPESALEPTVGYPSLAVACDSVEALVRRQTDVAVSRADGVPVDFGFGGPPRTGCELKASGKSVRAAADSAASPPQAQDDQPSTLAHAFEKAGWAYLAHYQADGPDGEAEGWRSKESTCVVRWSWDGGDDSDSTYVPSDDWDLVVGCTPTTASPA